MIRLSLLLLSLALPGTALAASVTGTLVGGGGTDDMRIIVRTSAGQDIEAYCTTKCGEWFDVEEGTEAYGLKRSLNGKRVRLEYAVEPNRDRVVGPDIDERLTFVKKVRVLQ